MQRLDGQVAIVTGGAMGIGGATARNAQQMRDAGGEVAVRAGDVIRPKVIQGMVADAVERWGARSLRRKVEGGISIAAGDWRPSSQEAVRCRLAF